MDEWQVDGHMDGCKDVAAIHFHLSVCQSILSKYMSDSI